VKRTKAEVRELKETIHKLKTNPKLEKAAREQTCMFTKLLVAVLKRRLHLRGRGFVCCRHLWMRKNPEEVILQMRTFKLYGYVAKDF